MNLKEMTIEQLEERRAAIANEIESPDADLDALEKEAREIKEELETRKQAEAKKAEIRSAVAAGQGTVIKKMEEPKKMNINEIRSSEEYINAFAQYAKTGDATECRALLSDNATNGTVPVPTFVADMVAERVKESKILSRVRKMNAAGNVKVGFEIVTPEASSHNEGVEVQEEALELGIATLVPTTFKKWVSISDEALDSMNGRQYLEYLYDEITRGIILAREKQVATVIYNAPESATRTQAGVGVHTITTPSISDFVNAAANLSSAAEDIVIIMDAATYAGYKGIQMSSTFGADPFDGHEVIINKYFTSPVIGDLKGIMENLPKGDEIEFKYDEQTLMTSDMVRVLGRQPSAIGVVGDHYFIKFGIGG